MFDKSNFKIRSFDILHFIRDFFKQPTGERDLTHVDEIRRYLSDIKPFSRLSTSLQNHILQEAWYESYSEQRTIVRQGDRNACFYIILSGSALVTHSRITDDQAETSTILERGCTFGEKGLMTDSQQISTVTSQTKVELLVLWKDDFKAIYMSNERYCSDDDLKFLKNNVPVLRGFPIDRLNEFHAIQHCNFGQAEVIARDSRRMKHIFVVKKGSLAVWKRLDPDGHIPKLTKHELEQTQDEKIIDIDDQEETADNSTLFSEIQFNSDVEEQEARNTKLNPGFRVRHSTTGDRKMSTNLSDSTDDIEKKFPGILDKRDRLPMIDYDQLTINAIEDIPESALKNEPSTRSRSMLNKQSKLILPNKMIYLHIKTINEGQSFGLTDMLFPNQPILTLISNECECLLLLKSSFVRIASDQYKQNIRRTEIPFPSDLVFYQSYHTNEVWKYYSKEVYKDVCKKMFQPKSILRSTTKKEQPSINVLDL